jgi:hypothetical protein
LLLKLHYFFCDFLQNGKTRLFIKDVLLYHLGSSINIMSDEGEREEIREENHELEDAEQDELEEDDDNYDEDETEQNT